MRTQSDISPKKAHFEMGNPCERRGIFLRPGVGGCAICSAQAAVAACCINSFPNSIC